MPAIITTPIRSFNIEQNKEAFSEFGFDRLYIFVGRTDAWDDEELPPVPVESTEKIFEAYRNMVGLKFIDSANMTNVCRRFDWTYGTIYDEYDDEVNMTNGFSVDDSSFPVFYVLTDEFNVYKCINNNQGSQSTVKPTGSSISAFETTDGYIWKYMYSLKASDVNTFLTNDWMPVQTLNVSDGSTQWTVQQNAIDGAIEDIKVVDGGLGYSDDDLPIIEITGDGTGAEAQPEVDSVTGTITKIRMTEVGSGYSYAEVNIDSNGSGGSGAVARAIMSPAGGHGFDPINELGGYFIMIATRLEGDEGGKIPEDIEYRQIGLIGNPLSTSDGKRIGLIELSGIFDNGDTITGQSSGAEGTVVKVNYPDNYIDVDVTSGSFLNGETIESGSTSAEIEYTDDIKLPLRALSASDDEIVFASGKLFYLENREKITRNVGQNELIKFVIEG